MGRIVEEELTGRIIEAAIEVHKYWGPGLYEKIYERSLAEELGRMDIPCATQLHLPLVYKGVTVGEDLQLDLLVDRKVVVEAKTVRELLPVHEAQLLTYMRLTNCRVGLLFNFKEVLLKEGIRRLVL